MILSRANLLPVLESLHRIIKRNALPITTCFKLRATTCMLTVTATNLDEFMELSCECVGALEPCCVSAGQLTLLAKAANDELSLRLKDGLLVVESSGTARLKTTPVEWSFPELPNDNQKPIAVNCEDLAECIEAVSWSCNGAGPQARALGETIWLKWNEIAIKSTAANGYTIARMAKPSIGSPAELVLYHEFEVLFRDALKRKGSGLFMGERGVKVQFEGGYYWCKLTEGIKWPNVDKNVFEQPLTALGEVLPSAVIPELETCISLCGGEFAPLRLWFGKDGLSMAITAKSGDLYEAKIAGSFADYEVSANPKYLLSCFKKMAYDKPCQIERTDGRSLKISEGGIQNWIQCLSE